VKHSDFRVGLEFVGSDVRRWLCADVGTRTILGVSLDNKNPDWYQGPPYIVEEVVFDEAEIVHCHLAVEEAIAAAALDKETGGNRAYPAEAIERMTKARSVHPYSHDGTLRFDRRRSDGEILHPYAGRRRAGTWMIDVYLPFQDSYEVMKEEEFIALPRATAQDPRSRADRAKLRETSKRLERLGGSDPDANAPPRRRGRPQ